MEDLFGQIECRSRSDSIVMRILRSAMDKTHEKLQFKDGPIEFLHERTLFYKLAAILVEGGLNIVQEETDILEGGGNEILADLVEIKQWLKGRIQDMKQLIVDKDGELAERLENEAKLWQALDQKDRELVYLHEKIEPERMMNDELNTDGDIFKLKSSVDQQMLNIKQRLEDERKILISERRARKSRISSPNLSFDFLDLERSGGLVVKEDGSFDDMKPLSELSRLSQNVLIKKMSSDIDILKETLDLAFGRMQSDEVLPLEKQWRWTIERDIESILGRGFISDLQRNFDVEVRKKVGVLKDEMRGLLHELEDSVSLNPLRRTTSEPLRDFSSTENNDGKDSGSHLVAKMIKSHESIICKQREQDTWLTRENPSSKVKKEKKRRIEDAIKKFDNFMQRNDDFSYKKDVQERRIPTNRSFATAERSRVDSQKQDDEKDGLCLQMSMLEDIYLLLFHSMMKDVSKSSDDSVDESIQQRYLESTIREDLCVVFFSETLKQLKEIFVREQESWRSEMAESRLLKQTSFRERTPRSEMAESRLLKQISFQERTPRSRKKETDGDESLIEKLDSLLKCFEAEEDLMLKASSIIKEHSASNSLIILNCEELDERDAIEWLITDDESTFSSVSEKLERALQQLYASKELLVDLEQSLEVNDAFEEYIEHEDINGDDQVSRADASDDVLASIMQFQKLFNDVEQLLLENLESKSLRVEALKRQVDTLIEPVSLIRTRKLIYKKAFISRCHNLRLAETEVDVLGDQVESLVHLLEKIYVLLNRNASVLSRYFEVYDILKLIKLELNK